MTVATSTDELTTNGFCSLREAVRNANATSAPAPHPDCPAGDTTGSDTIIVPSGFFIKLTVVGGNEDAAATGDLDLTGPATITGGGQLTTVVSGNLSDRVFDVRPDATVRISGLRIENGQVTEADGGGILNRGVLTLTNSLVTRNSVMTAALGLVTGGGINNASGSLTISNSSISGNSASGPGQGGGVGQTTLLVGRPVLTITNSLITGNTASAEGGGIHSGFGDVELRNTVVAANTAGDRGGGFTFRAPTGGALDVSNVLFQENRGSRGGGMWIDTPSPATLKGVRLLQNQATSGAGGGLHLQKSGPDSITLGEISAIENTAFEDGGGLFVGGSGSGSVEVTRAAIVDNNSFHGDGIQNSLGGGGTLTVTNATIAGNGTTGGGDGGGVNNASGATLVLANVSLNENTAGLGYGGGNIYNAGSLTVRNTIAANPQNGGQCALVQPLTQGGRNLENPTGAAPCGFALTGDPLLAPLADNGGESPTHALQPGSAAINQGTGCAAADQRGVPRALGGKCDIGAYERVTCFGQAANRIGTDGANRMSGDATAEVFLTLGGNDVVNPRGGNDRLCLGAGNDTARIRGNGTDRADGQAGSRDLVLRGAEDIVRGFERFG